MLVILLSLFSFHPAQALVRKDVGELDRWADRKQAELFQDCSKTKLKDWAKRYDEIELDWVEKTESIGRAAIDDRKNSPHFWDFGSIVFPQDLPEHFPLKGMFVSCVKPFHDLRAEKKVQKSSTEVDACYRDAYRKEAPPVMDLLLKCLKQLKH